MKDVIINTAFALGVCSILVLLAMAIVASFIEEGKRGPDAVHNQIMMVGQDNSRVDLYVDRLTGCHYWANYDGGITPRMTPDGAQLCTETPE